MCGVGGRGSVTVFGLLRRRCVKPDGKTARISTVGNCIIVRIVRRLNCDDVARWCHTRSGWVMRGAGAGSGEKLIKLLGLKSRRKLIGVRQHSASVQPEPPNHDEGAGDEPLIDSRLDARCLVDLSPQDPRARAPTELRSSSCDHLPVRGRGNNPSISVYVSQSSSRR